MADEPVLDLDVVVSTLTTLGVRFIVVGGQAAAAWGSPSLTRDLDVAYARDRPNLGRLAAALRDLDAKLRAPGVDAELPFQLAAETLERGFNFTVRTPHGDLDLLGLPPGVDGYDELEPNAVPVQLAGHTVLVASLDDLIRMKVAAGRPKDRVEVEILAALRDERDRRGMTDP